MVKSIDLKKNLLGHQVQAGTLNIKSLLLLQLEFLGCFKNKNKPNFLLMLTYSCILFYCIISYS